MPVSARRWSDNDIPSLDGKTAMVTGANSGLGLETAQRLAMRGARVVLAGIGDAATTSAMQKITALAPNAQLENLTLDLGDLASVRAAAQTFLNQHKRLDILVNNAGVFGLPYGQTKDGFERLFGINHLGHFAFTVVTITSVAHRTGKLPLDDLNWEQRRYSIGDAYSQSKLANLMFALELDRRFRRANIDAISVAAHPGYAATNIFFSKDDKPPTPGRRLWNQVAKLGAKTLAQPASRGAWPALYAATSEDVQGGQFFGPHGLLEFRGYPAVAVARAQADNVALAGELWRHSEQLTGVEWL